jgi:hypothetical protein
LPQKALGHVAPVQALKAWKMKAPDLFVKNMRNHPGPDTYAGLLLLFYRLMSYMPQMKLHCELRCCADMTF